MPNPGSEKASGVGEENHFWYRLFLHYTLPTGGRVRLADNLCNVRGLCQRRRKASVSISLRPQVARSRAWRLPCCRPAPTSEQRGRTERASSLVSVSRLTAVDDSRSDPSGRCDAPR